MIQILMESDPQQWRSIRQMVVAAGFIADCCCFFHAFFKFAALIDVLCQGCMNAHAAKTKWTFVLLVAGADSSIFEFKLPRNARVGIVCPSTGV